MVNCLQYSTHAPCSSSEQKGLDLLHHSIAPLTAVCMVIGPAIAEGMYGGIVIWTNRLFECVCAACTPVCCAARVEKYLLVRIIIKVMILASSHCQNRSVSNF
jgi:hypothetical protein